MVTYKVAYYYHTFDPEIMRSPELGTSIIWSGTLDSQGGHVPYAHNYGHCMDGMEYHSMCTHQHASI